MHHACDGDGDDMGVKAASGKRGHTRDTMALSSGDLLNRALFKDDKFSRLLAY